jgi:RND family efflux transporter MFP subunit
MRVTSFSAAVTFSAATTTDRSRKFPGAASLLPACLALLLAGIGCRKPAPEMAPPPPPPSVTVSVPTVQDVTEFAEYTGRTVAIETVEIRARVEGVLETIHFTPGERVAKGDLLFTIERAPYEARLDEALATLSAKEADLALAEATLERREKAFGRKAVSEVDVIAARSGRDAAKAAVEGARAAIIMARLDLSYTGITAPVGGQTGRNLVDAGNLVGAGERTLLATIVNNDAIYAYFTVNERDLLRLRARGVLGAGSSQRDEKTPVFLSLSDSSDDSAAGHVDFVDHSVDPGMGTVEVRAVFPNDGHRLVPGLFARVRFPVEERKQALLVPERALGKGQEGTYLLVVGAGEIVEQRIVTTGARIDGLRVIEEGLAPDDRVIVNGMISARPGMPVTAHGEGEPVGGPQE